MEKNKIIENNSERGDKINSKTLLSQNIPLDLSHNSLLSSKVTTKNLDKKNSINKANNIAAVRSINKKKKNQFNDDSFSFENSKYETPKTKKKEKKKMQNNKNLNDKISVDDIQNIYSSISNKSNKLFYIQKML